MTKLPNFPLFLGSLFNWLHENQSTKPKATCQVARPSALYLQVAWPWWVAHNTNVFPLIWGLRSRKTHQNREFYKQLVVVGIDVKGLQGILVKPLRTQILRASQERVWNQFYLFTYTHRIFNIHTPENWKNWYGPPPQIKIWKMIILFQNRCFSGAFSISLDLVGFQRVSTCGLFRLAFEALWWYQLSCCQTSPGPMGSHSFRSPEIFSGCRCRRLLGAMEVLKILEAERRKSTVVAWKWKKKKLGSLLACCGLVDHWSLDQFFSLLGVM